MLLLLPTEASIQWHRGHQMSIATDRLHVARLWKLLNHFRRLLIVIMS